MMGVTGSKNVFGTALKHCTLWKADRSPACRAVMMGLDVMQLNINEVDVNLDKGEHRTQEISDLNCLQTLPILKDRDLVLCDSHTINTYLASRYCNEKLNRLLPNDAGGRALVEQLMHYDSGVLYPRFRAVSYPILYESVRTVMPHQVCDIECSYADLDKMLLGKTWLGGSWATLGDISIAATVSTLDIVVPIDKERFPRLSSWLHRMSEEMFYLTANKKGLCEFSRRIDSGCECGAIDFHCPRSSDSRRSFAGFKNKITTQDKDKQ